MGGVFDDVLSNARDVSQIYYDNTSLQRELSDDPAAFTGLLAVMRKQMEQNGGIRRISAISNSVIKQIEQAHISGQIAAVDGTDAISITEMMSKTVYAAAVLSTTAQTLHEPHIKMTESHRQIPQITNATDFFDFIERLNHWVDEDHSWIRAFREYCERQEALRLIDEDGVWLVLIDGPLYTQNLLFQPAAQSDVLNKMQTQHSDRLIGFIKDLHSSKLMHLAGIALEPDEYWTISRWRNLLLGRFAREPQRRQWINSTSDWVRTIYRKNAKAFAFECHPLLVDIGVAIIASPITCAGIINHEIPFLLHSADRIVRAKLAAVAKSENLISASPYYANLANERIFR
jgi:hypothetical protein